MGTLGAGGKGPAARRRPRSVLSGWWRLATLPGRRGVGQGRVERAGHRRRHAGRTFWAMASTIAVALVALSIWGQAPVGTSASQAGASPGSHPTAELMATLNSAVVAPGSGVVVRAGGFAPGSRVEIGLQSQNGTGSISLTGMGRASGQGHLAAVVRVPGSTHPGPYVVYLFGRAPGGASVSDQVAVSVG